MTIHFFRDLQGFGRFSELTDAKYYVSAPAEWYVVATDIKGSTQAIADGHYKEVNLIGAAAIMAVLNIAGDVAVPYAFGGDGATMLVPESLLAQTRKTLAAVRAKVQSMFGLELRVGCVPLKTLYEQGASLSVGKFFLSPNIAQAVFQGTALNLAETWLKKGGGPVLACEMEGSDDPDLQGLECRWQPIENRNGEILTLLVRVTPKHAADAMRIYADTIRDIEAIYPDYAKTCPTYAAGMHLSFSPAGLNREAKLRATNLISRMLYLVKILIINSIGQFSFVTKKPVGTFDGKRYLSELVANSDARKFDEMLRMVLDSTKEQHEALERMLKARHGRGEILYGIHISSQALMTCLVFSLAGNHVHFIDGSDGGYALAARQMKAQAAVTG